MVENFYSLQPKQTVSENVDSLIWHFIIPDTFFTQIFLSKCTWSVYCYYGTSSAVFCPVMLDSVPPPCFHCCQRLAVRSHAVAKRGKKKYFDHFADDILIESGLILSNVFPAATSWLNNVMMDWITHFFFVAKMSLSIGVDIEDVIFPPSWSVKQSLFVFSF